MNGVGWINYRNEGTNRTGIKWTTNKIVRDSLVAAPGVEKGVYKTRWTIDGVPGINYYANFNVEVKNPQLKVARVTGYWDYAPNTQMAPGDTTVAAGVNGVPTPATINGIPTRGIPVWVMTSVPSNGFSTDNTNIEYPVGEPATCGKNLTFMYPNSTVQWGEWSYRLVGEPDVSAAGKKDSAVVVRPVLYPNGQVKQVVAITNKYEYNNIYGNLAGDVDPTGYGDIGVGNELVAKKYVADYIDNQLVGGKAVTVQLSAAFPTSIAADGVSIKLPVEIEGIDAAATGDKSYFFLRFRNPLKIETQPLTGMAYLTGNIKRLADSTFWGKNIIVHNEIEPNRFFRIDTIGPSNADFDVANPFNAVPVLDKIQRYFTNVTANQVKDKELNSVKVFPMQDSHGGIPANTYYFYESPAGNTETKVREGEQALTFYTTWGQVITGTRLKVYLDPQ